MTWRTARSLDVIKAQVDEMAPGRSRASDGTIGDDAHQSGTSDHNPDGAAIVRARDITHDPANGADMNRLADDLVASRDPRIKYVIWSRRICSGAAGPSPWKWRPYSGSNPHTKHLHLSVVGDSRADQTHRWTIGDDDMTTPAQFLAILRDPAVQHEMRKLPLTYPVGPNTSLLGLLTGMAAQVAQLSGRDLVDEPAIVTGVLAGLGTRPAADVATALVAAGQDPTTLATELTRLADRQ